MASLRRKDNSPYWFACFTDANGRRAQRSTKQRDRRKAQTVADHYDRAARLARENRFSEVQARRVISDIYEMANGEPLASSTAKAFLSEWPEKRRNEIAPRTYRAYSQVARDFLKSLGPKADRDISQINKHDVIKYREQVSAKTSVTTANKIVKYVRVALNAAWKAGLAMDNPAAKVDLLARRLQKQPQRRAFTDAELKAVLAVADPEWYALILFGYYTGQRLSDLGSLRWSNLDLEKGTVIFTTRKTGRAMDIPIAPPLWDYIKKSMRSPDSPETPLFPSSYPIAISQTGDSRLSQRFHVLLERAGLAQPRSKEETGLGRSRKRVVNALSFHSLRHTTTTVLKVCGATEAVAMDIIGHESRAISTVYTHIDIEAKRKALANMPDITKAT